jgi:hypothetical protein
MKTASAAAIAIGVVALGAGCEVLIPPEPGTFMVRAVDLPGCNVDTDPPEVCGARNVANALVIAMIPGSGEVVAQGRTDHDGRVFLEVPAGEYVIAGRQVDGLITPEPLRLEVTPGGRVDTTLHYQSGIRTDNDGHP